ncbi:MAG: DUF1461 domain-containing protein [Clostridia bacterium]|nr:DUF1461 domain-containing protein [Clostridia bacterium]
MKKLSWITGVLTCVVLLAAALGCALNAVWQIAIDETFYSDQSRAAVMDAMGYTTEEEVTAYIGLTPEEQKIFAQTTSAYMLGEDQSIDLPVYVSEDEVRHMIDVRGLIWRARDWSKALLSLSVVLAIVSAWTGAKLKKRVLPRLIGGLSAVSIAALLAVGIVNQMSTGNFEALFVRMHEMLFTNDLWLMNPATDILIRIMPLPLFEQALADAAIRAMKMLVIAVGMLLAVMISVERMLRRHTK